MAPNHQTSTNYSKINFLQIYFPLILYYFVGIGYIHWQLGWSFVDSILITTASMSAGKDIFTHSQSTRVFFSLFTIIGALLLLNLLSSFIITEVRISREFIKSFTVSPLTPTEISNRTVYIRRLLHPLAYLAIVILIGTLFFMLNETWTFIDSLYFCVALRSITASDGLNATTDNSKYFLLIYQWIFILSVMNIISSLCALRVELTELLDIRMKLQKAQNISSLALEPSSFSGDNIDQFEFLVKLLIHLNILDEERDVDLWLEAIQGFCQNQSGRLTRGDILAFAESYRRKFLTPDNKMIHTPPSMQLTTSNPLPRKTSPSQRHLSFSPVSNYPSSSLLSPTTRHKEMELSSSSSTTTAAATAAVASTSTSIMDDRTPLLPIEHHVSNQGQGLRTQQNLSESPLTFGKKSSYGLFIPQSYQRSKSTSSFDQPQHQQHQHQHHHHQQYQGGHDVELNIPYDELDDQVHLTGGGS